MVADAVEEPFIPDMAVALAAEVVIGSMTDGYAEQVALGESGQSSALQMDWYSGSSGMTATFGEQR